MRWIICASLLCVCILFGPIAHADSAPLAPFAAGVIPAQETSVSMVTEWVDIRLEPADNTAPAYHYHRQICHVTARFELLSDREESLVVGYPIGPLVFGVPGEWIPPDQIHVSVDGQTVDLEVRTASGPSAAGGEERWVTWSMEFVPGVVRVVTVAHSTTAQLRSALSPIKINYVLLTGAGWAGPIGTAVINLDPGLGRIIEATPGSSRHGSTMTWTFSDLEPEFDIQAVISNPVWTDQALGKQAQLNGPELVRAARAALALGIEWAHEGEQRFLDHGVDPGRIRSEVEWLYRLPAARESFDALPMIIGACIAWDLDCRQSLLFTRLSRALRDGHDMSWWSELPENYGPIALSARCRAGSDDEELNALIADVTAQLVLSHAVTGLTIEDRVNWDGSWSTRATGLVQDSSGRRLVPVTVPDPRTRSWWSWGRRRVEIGRTLSPNQAWAWLAAAVVRNHPAGTEAVAADIARFAHGHETEISYHLTPPGQDTADLVVTVRPGDADTEQVESWSGPLSLWPVVIAAGLAAGLLIGRQIGRARADG